MEPLELKVATMDQATTMTAERRRKRREIKEVTRVTKEARIIGHKFMSLLQTYFGHKSLEIKSHEIDKSGEYKYASMQTFE